MRRNKYQDKYLKFILEHKKITKLQKLWLVYWFLDKNGYPVSIGYIERQIGIAKGKTHLRITGPLIEIKIIKQVGEQYIGDPATCKPTPIYDFTDEVEEAVKAMTHRHGDGTHSQGVSMTRHFYYDEGQNVASNSQGDLNNKRTNETKEYQDFDEFSEGKNFDLASFDVETMNQLTGDNDE